MDEYIRMSIDAKRSAIFDTYTVTKENNLKMIEDFFKKLEIFAEGFKDPVEFESKFAESELFQEYSNLYLELHKTEKSKYVENNNDFVEPTDNMFGEMVVEEVKDEAKFRAKEMAGSAIYGAIFDAIGDDNPELKKLVLEVDTPLDDLLKG